MQAPLLSLPRLFGTTQETVPAAIPYLSADPELVEQWRRRLAMFPEFKIGIVWKGNPLYRNDRDRSLSLSLFEPIARFPGVRLFSLQKGPGNEEVARYADRVPLTDLSPELDENTGAFVDTAAVLKNLDLVISVDTAVTHLAGALAVPTWLLLPYACEWRWLLDREDTPWYPTVRLWRCKTPGAWPEVMDRVAAAVRSNIS